MAIDFKKVFPKADLPPPVFFGAFTVTFGFQSRTYPVNSENYQKLVDAFQRPDDFVEIRTLTNRIVFLRPSACGSITLTLCGEKLRRDLLQQKEDDTFGYIEVVLMMLAGIYDASADLIDAEPKLARFEKTALDTVRRFSLMPEAALKQLCSAFVCRTDGTHFSVMPSSRLEMIVNLFESTAPDGMFAIKTHKPAASMHFIILRRGYPIRAKRRLGRKRRSPYSSVSFFQPPT